MRAAGHMAEKRFGLRLQVMRMTPQPAASVVLLHGALMVRTTAGQRDVPRPDSGLVRPRKPGNRRCREGFSITFSWHKSC